MGCDIHMCVEIRKNDAWYNVDKLIAYEEWEYADYPSETPHSPWVVAEEIYDSRNYILFGRLAGIRGDNAFMSPRGFPLDISDVAREIIDFEYNYGDHSAHWYSLEELLSFKWREVPVYNEDTDEDEWKRLPQYSLDSLAHFFQQRKKVNGRLERTNSAMCKLIDIKKQYNLKEEDVRIVFWFDS